MSERANFFLQNRKQRQQWEHTQQPVYNTQCHCSPPCNTHRDI